MQYKKIESEIDNLLRNPEGLNPYERRLLRKTKRYLCKVNEGVRDLYETKEAFKKVSNDIMSASMSAVQKRDAEIRSLKDKIWNQRPIWFLIGAVAFRVCEMVVYYVGR